ncbi:hypothetical protein SJAV_07380 [Sulfurisphaera javensis]|uniref:Uncharacterized protein n=1 Tax=Sulfurisphaera javensis TaxID=2049879 RepID=A0AAT9GQ27_9CREN
MLLFAEQIVSLPSLYTMVSTIAPPSSVPFEDVFGFALAGAGIAFGIIFYLLIRKKTINIF